MSYYFKPGLSNVLILGMFMLWGTASMADCMFEKKGALDNKIINYLKKLRPESCKDWPYTDPKLSSSSCQDCVERIADICRFVLKHPTPMSWDQKSELDQRCNALQQK